MLPDSALGSWHQAEAEDALRSSSTVTFTGVVQLSFPLSPTGAWMEP